MLQKNIEIAMEFVVNDKKEEAVKSLKNVWQSIWASANHLSFQEYAFALLCTPFQDIKENEGNLDEFLQEKIKEMYSLGMTQNELSEKISFFFRSDQGSDIH
jgi:hypothetical protein